ncbi:MAG: DUF3109 family protein [Paludibacteraceae bacterium]|nr:DUF3109 family protein [Paludibacteraceae bacterium]
MIQIEDTIVSFDFFDKQFCCDLAVCKGICCIEGDSGAPLEQEELIELEQVLPFIWDDLPKKSKEVIEKQGLAYVDVEGDLVTSIVDGKECVFAYTDEKGFCKCAIEKAWKEGKISFRKPISCHLYPARLTKYTRFTAVNFHSWNICRCANLLGKKENIPVYKFLKEAFVRRFGEEWYLQLEMAADVYYAEKRIKK